MKYNSEKKQKILFIVSQPFIEWRGSPLRAWHDVRTLGELGYEVHLLTLPLGKCDPLPDVQIIRVPNLFAARRIGIGPSVLKLAFDFLLLVKGLVLSLRHNYIVIHCIEDAAIPGFVIACITRVKLLYEKHSDPHSYYGGFWRNLVMHLYEAVERVIIRKASCIICTNTGLLEQVKLIAPNKPAYHIFDLPSSMVDRDPDKAKEIRGRICPDNTKVLITYAGSFASYQGIDLIFDAIPLVIKSKPQAMFVIIGGSPQQIEERKQQLAKQQLANSTIFLGIVPPSELIHYLSASDILLCPRLRGVNAPLKVFDYLKAGRAIVATDVPANRSLLNEKTSILVKPDVLSFAEAICYLIENRNVREQLGKNSRLLLEREYNIEKFKSLLNICYQTSILAGK
jgi:glycosyltransferase involved in cell wall biosynthesis